MICLLNMDTIVLARVYWELRDIITSLGREILYRTDRQFIQLSLFFNLRKHLIVYLKFAVC